MRFARRQAASASDGDCLPYLSLSPAISAYFGYGVSHSQLDMMIQTRLDHVFTR